MHPDATLPQPNEDASQRSSQSYWPRWSENLRRWGLDAPVEALLDAAGPLSVVLAQFVYLGQPFLRSGLPGSQVGALARLLEDPDAAGRFAASLREEEGD